MWKIDSTNTFFSEFLITLVGLGLLWQDEAFIKKSVIRDNKLTSSHENHHKETKSNQQSILMTTNHQGTTQCSAAASSYNDIIEITMVPTFRPSQEIKKMVLNAATLANSSNLKATDPFMYYSLYSPTDTISRSRLASAMQQNEDGDQGSNANAVERKSCVSAESDPVTFAVKSMTTPNDDGADGRAGETTDEEEKEET
jgi:hypothetical protein